MSMKTLYDIINNIYMDFKTKETVVFNAEKATFNILKQLYRLNNSGNLAPESRIFLECENCISHINTIVNDVFYGEENSIIDSISSELDVINRIKKNDDKALLLMAERIKHGLTQNTDRLHGHIKYIDTNSNIMSKLDNNDLSMQVLHKRLDSLEKSILNGNLNSSSRYSFSLKVPEEREQDDDEDDDEDDEDEDDDDGKEKKEKKDDENDESDY